jgi:hypothetical protein
MPRVGSRRLARVARTLTAGRRMLPTFLVIGAQKAGTTSLHDVIADHPDVGRPEVKEVHFFDWHVDRASRWYRSHFPFEGTVAHAGEATPYYLVHPEVPGRVHRLLPHVRLLVLLRDPVQRAISHYHHNVALGFEDLPLAEALAREPERLHGTAGQLRRQRVPAHERFTYVTRGLYAEQLRSWFAWFDRAQVQVLYTEDLATRPRAVAADVHAFLGLRPFAGARMPRLNARRYPEPDAGVVRWLADRFAASDAELGRLLGAPPRWLDRSGEACGSPSR